MKLRRKKTSRRISSTNKYLLKFNVLNPQKSLLTTHLESLWHELELLPLNTNRRFSFSTLINFPCFLFTRMRTNFNFTSANLGSRIFSLFWVCQKAVWDWCGASKSSYFCHFIIGAEINQQAHVILCRQCVKSIWMSFWSTFPRLFRNNVSKCCSP